MTINPRLIWIGYNSRPTQVKLPEPSLEKVKRLIHTLRNNGYEVKEKDMREQIEGGDIL